MSIPDYETLMLPILEYLSDKEEKKTRQLIDHIINLYEISKEEAKVLIPSGRAKLIDNRVGWACTHLRKAGLINSPQRGHNVITNTGLKVLDDNITRIDNKYLKQFKDFQEFRSTEEATINEDIEDNKLTEKTPEEIIGIQSQIINSTISKDILDTISNLEPSQFEQLIIDLLLAMGYGGTIKDAGTAIGQTNDGGVDGIIKEDILGLGTIYVQAKRWQNTVPIREIRDFAGALLSKKSNKGVFITTSNYPKTAYEFVSTIDRKIRLIDGEELAELMIEYNLGVSIKETIEIKEIDIDYFTT